MLNAAFKGSVTAAREMLAVKDRSSHLVRRRTAGSGVRRASRERTRLALRLLSLLASGLPGLLLAPISCFSLFSATQRSQLASGDHSP